MAKIESAINKKFNSHENPFVIISIHIHSICSLNIIERHKTELRKILNIWNITKIVIFFFFSIRFPFPENNPTLDSPESSFSSATSTTSTGTVVCNALKPKNSQSVSQTSLQSTGISTTPSSNVDKSANKCHLVKCSYRDVSQKDLQSSSGFAHHGTIRQIIFKIYSSIYPFNTSLQD